MHDKFEEYMDNLKKPTVDVTGHQREFRLTLLDTKKSAWIGVGLLIVPFLFLSGVILKHYLQLDVGIFTSVYQWIGELDRKFGDRSLINWIFRILLLFGPMIAIVLNLWAILHVRYDKDQKEIVMSLKLKWLNLIILLISGLVFSVFFLYLLMENA